MKMTLVSENKTRVRLSNKTEKFIVEQLKFFGAVPVKESSIYTQFDFNGDISKTSMYLGFR
jgi:hypothetical protein